MDKKNILALATGAMLLLAGAGCGSRSTTPSGEAKKLEPSFTAVTFNPDGISPKQITLRVGEGIEFRNSDLKSHWPASAPHPAHTDYLEFDPKQEIKPGDTWRFVFTKKGTWKFHDHLGTKPQFAGSVIVAE